MAKVKVGINGFGRIGRQVLKKIIDSHSDTLEVVAINGLESVKSCAYLFKYDSNYGRFNGTVEIQGENLIVINGSEIKCMSHSDPKEIPWSSLGVELVIESSGAFTDAAKAKWHIEYGKAKRVIICAPAKNNPDATFVFGVNHKTYDPAKHYVVSNASCTTNGLAPPAYVIHKAFGIEKALMTTIHSYTNDQRVLDVDHSDLRRARAAALNIIPTTTGAAKAIDLIIPEFKGKFDGYSLRVPTPTVSVIDLVMDLSRETTTEEMLAVLKKASENELKNIMGYDEEGLVSTDYKGCPLSSIIDAPFCKVHAGNMAKLVAWYDNEWGYSCRVCDLASFMVSKGM